MKIKVIENKFVLNKTYRLNKYLAIVITGLVNIKVDFVEYTNMSNKVCFLNPNHSFCFTKVKGNFLILEIPLNEFSYSMSYDVLFKHVESVGHIDVYKDVENFLTKDFLNVSVEEFLNFSVMEWYKKNPFNVTNYENELIFQFKSFLDNYYEERFDINRIKNIFGVEDYNKLNNILQKKLSKTVKKKMLDKLLVESKRKLMYSDKSINQISDDLKFNDSAYFINFFKSKTNITPSNFRKQNNYDKDFTLINRLVVLVKKHHIKHRKVAFYASELSVSEKHLSNIVKRNKGISLSNLIKKHLIETAKRTLQEGNSISESAFILNFKEVSHFSSFFKLNIGISPREFKNKE